ncbi:MAG TPA: HAMP domain-containing sensor histidine kinase [Blastocatellia bacterium]|nr:HAMP domain-containing sensor histidine kinase [Blastocatellia bacterium]
MAKAAENGDFILNEVFAALDVLVIERSADGSFRSIGFVPGWFAWLYPQAAGNTENLQLSQLSSFLKNFLIDAEEFWREQRPGQLRSGAWSETGAAGKEDHLEAIALSVGSRKILLIELLGSAYEERRRLLQIARENVLVQRQMVREIQKKEILLHSIAHDLANLLMGVRVSFSLLGAENLSASGREYLMMGQRQHAQQEKLIQDLTQAFTAEMESLTPFHLDSAKAPDALVCAKDVIQEMASIASLHKVNLQLDQTIDDQMNWLVISEQARLERVISNLVENALRYSTPFSTVVIGLHQDDSHVQINVDDEGSGIPPEMNNTIFYKFTLAAQPGGHFGFGLYYCRVMVERWGGSIGYLPRQPRGSRFWLRLSKLGTN